MVVEGSGVEVDGASDGGQGVSEDNRGSSNGGNGASVQSRFLVSLISLLKA